jgi:hypothetical protein
MKMKNILFVLFALPGVLWAQYTGGVGGGYVSDESDAGIVLSTPGNYDLTILNGKYIVDANITFNTANSDGENVASIVVNPGKALNINVQLFMTTDGRVRSLANTSNYSQILFNQLVTFPGQATFSQQQFVPQNGWHNMGMPLTEDTELTVFGTVNQETGAEAAVNLQYWDAATSTWTKAENFENHEPGRGYNAFVGNIGVRPNPGIIEVTGKPNISPVTPILTYHDPGPTAPNFSSAITDGWNLIANPFSATLDLEAVLGSPSTQHVENAYYIWNPGTNSYDYWAPASAPPPLDIPNLSGFVPPMQSFWVRATGLGTPTLGALSFSNTNITESPVFRKQSDIQGHAILSLSDVAGTKSDDLTLAFIPGTTPGFDNGWDARKMQNPNPSFNFYTLGNEEALSINAVDYDPNSNSVYSIPLGMANVKTGQDLSISLAGLEDFPRLAAFIEDTKDGSFHNLTHGPFNFKAANNNPDQQYVFHISGVPGWTPKDLVTGVNAWVNGDYLHLLPLNLEGDAKIFIADMTGRDIWSHPESVRLQSNQQQSIDMPVQLASGVYLLKVVANGKVHVVKFVQ